MAFIKLSSEATTVGEAQNVPTGRYNLRVVSKEYDEEKHYYVLDIAVENPPKDISEPYPIRYWLNMPTGADIEKDKNRWRFARRFLHLFGIPYTVEGFDDSDLEGATAENVMVTVGTYKKDGQDKTKLELDVPPTPKDAFESFEGRGRGGRAKSARRA